MRHGEVGCITNETETGIETERGNEDGGGILLVVRNIYFVVCFRRSWQPTARVMICIHDVLFRCGLMVGDVVSAHANPSILCPTPLSNTRPDPIRSRPALPRPARPPPLKTAGGLLEGVRSLRAWAVVRVAHRPGGDRDTAMAVRGRQERPVLAGRLGQAPPDGDSGERYREIPRGVASQHKYLRRRRI